MCTCTFWTYPMAYIRVSVCGGVLYCVAVYRSVFQLHSSAYTLVAVYSSALQCVAVHCIVLQLHTRWHSYVLQCSAVRLSVLQLRTRLHTHCTCTCAYTVVYFAAWLLSVRYILRRQISLAPTNLIYNSTLQSYGTAGVGTTCAIVLRYTCRGVAVCCSVLQCAAVCCNNVCNCAQVYMSFSEMVD